MNIPPFPAHDLAKLVLGYLAEEQLMTAYDEFLSASPYLDAQKNEYDRIFMTSLKNILAEYRAVKIYVETCKPYALRRRLIGCTNLLEIVKFLVQHVDVSKLQANDGNRESVDVRSISNNRSTNCVVCHSLTLTSCVCKSRQSILSANTQPNETENLENSVETTSLEDLPGNHVKNRKKQVKTLSKDSQMSHSVLISDSNSDSPESNTPGFNHTLPNNSQNLTNRLSTNVCSVPSNTLSTNFPQPQQMMMDMYDSKTGVNHRSCNTHIVTSHRMSTGQNFQEFSRGIKGGENINCNVPDSSTADNYNKQSNISKEFPLPGRACVDNVKPVTKAHIFFTVGTISSPSTTCAQTQQTKSTESKVTILSDIKVDNLNDKNKMPAVLSNAQSSPLMHMQTVLINGTPVYKPRPAVSASSSRNFTKDEIMAMPTIIVVPTSGESQIPSHCRTMTAAQPARSPAPAPVPAPACASASASTPATAPAPAPAPAPGPARSPLQPLVIDVPEDAATHTTAAHNMPSLDLQKKNETENLVKTVDTKMVSAPKEGGESKNTPQVPPPQRKSSSTPRRTSHVRVLDFTTPRRILQEAVSENVSEDGGAPVEVVISRSPDLHTLAGPSNAEHTATKTMDKTNNVDGMADSSGSSKENDKIPTTALTTASKRHWDADLRAVAIPNKKEDIPISRIQPRCRPRQKNTNKSTVTVNNKKSKEKKKKNNKKNIKEEINANISKCKKKADEVEDAIEEPVIVVDENPNTALKPSINIISNQDWAVQEKDKVDNNSELTETPEMERLSLQNAIGVKLNISDLLETPYKQALYDIQMETPRFLGPDLPGEPMSDIKIMNIPTPRFLDTLKPVQATPSYASRPTDYSSGSSYYKPDDQDYVISADLGYPASESKDKEVTSPTNVEEGTIKDGKNNPTTSTKSRPVRRCTKNVSYYQSPHVNKHKESDDKLETVSLCSDTVSLKSVNENMIEKDSALKTVKINKSIVENKLVTEHTHAKENQPSKQNKPKAKKKSASKKHKSPVKKETPKSFMKIKPRRVTPTKEVSKGRSRKNTESEARKRTASKASGEVAPAIICAPTKSRRKSSTPRKLHCTKVFNSESSGHDSPETTSKAKNIVDRATPLPSAQDSDTDQVKLHWSDDGSQDVNELPTNNLTNETEDISKIKEYIATELQNVEKIPVSNDRSGNLQVDLIQRGFDAETAKIIERDLLDSPTKRKEPAVVSLPQVLTEIKNNEAVLEKTLESDTSTSLKIVQEHDDDEEEEIELSVSECNEESKNYIICNHDDLKEMPRAPAAKLKDNFLMEICIDDDVTVRLRATPFSTVLDVDPQDQELIQYDEKETESAVNSISNMEKLYTPMKENIRAQVYELFDSTLTSLDTPLKANSPKKKICDTTVTQIVLEVEEVKEKPADKKRKRMPSMESTDSAASSSKRTKPEAEYLLNSANIQNIDIETVLSKLHGP